MALLLVRTLMYASAELPFWLGGGVTLFCQPRELNLGDDVVTTVANVSFRFYSGLPLHFTCPTMG